MFILEFPAVLINLQNHVIEAEFHTFIRPTENPTLSDFCTTFTGITQETVDEGVSLAQALEMFDRWVNGFRFSKDITLIDGTKKQNTVLITWTDLDLGVYLPRECDRKSIIRPEYFRQWIDLRDFYSVS